MEKMVQIRREFDGMMNDFPIVYEARGGSIASSFNSSGTVAGIKRAITQIFGAAFINPGILPPNFGISELNHLKEPPSFDKVAYWIEATNVNANVDLRRTVHGLSFTVINAGIAAGTNLFRIAYPISLGSMVMSSGLVIQGVGPSSILTIATPVVSNAAPMLLGATGNISFMGCEPGYECSDPDFQAGYEVLRAQYPAVLPQTSVHGFLVNLNVVLNQGVLENHEMIHFAQAACVTLGVMERYTSPPDWILRF
jgi:hypothetical protein